MARSHDGRETQIPPIDKARTEPTKTIEPPLKTFQESIENRRTSVLPVDFVFAETNPWTINSELDLKQCVEKSLRDTWTMIQ